MRWKATWLLCALALALFAFIVLVERRYWRPTAAGSVALPRLVTFKATEATNIQVRITNQVVVWVERADETSLWRLTPPFSYPGSLHAIDRMLGELEQITTQTYLSPEELRAAHRSPAEFGLDVPQATVALIHNGQRSEILFGNRTPTGEMVYAQDARRPGIFVVAAEVFNRLPRNANSWRDTALFNLSGFDWNRIELRAASRSFAVDYEPATKSFVLSKPTPARADAAKVELLLRNLLTVQVREFVNDNPRADGEPYGLQPPELELAFVKGTNDQLVVQFGKSPSTNSALVYARRMLQTNIVLVPRAILDNLPASASDLRDRRLITGDLTQLDSIDVIGTNNQFTVRRQTNGLWTTGEAQPMAADLELMRDWLMLLVSLEGTVESDVVTDYKTLYNLSPPARQYLLKASVTNAVGSVSNRVVAELDLGAVQGDKVFARRPDEATVYSVPLTNVLHLPRAAWQLRDRRVWAFTTNQVSRLEVMDHDRTNVLGRSSSHQWSIVAGNVIISDLVGFSYILDELMFRLGELRADTWVAQGDENRALFGFDPPVQRLTIELKNGDKPRGLSLEFGANSPGGWPYALASGDGQTWIFEIPQASYVLLKLQLFARLFRDGL